jgi:hypothetical protein
MLNDAAPGATLPMRDVLADSGVTKRSFAVVAGGGAVLGALAGVAIAVALAVTQGPMVLLATALDIAAGLALIGGLIGANFAGTD